MSDDEDDWLEDTVTVSKVLVLIVKGRAACQADTDGQRC